MHIFLICLAAFFAMLVLNIVSVAEIQATNRNKAAMSGLLDVISWLVALFTTFISLDALDGNNLALKVSVIATVSAANFIGSVMGVNLGKKYIRSVRLMPPVSGKPPHTKTEPPHVK